MPFPSLVYPVRAHRSVSCAARAPQPSTRGSIAPPPFSKRPGVRTQGDHPSHAFISPSITQSPRNCSPELVAPPRDFSHHGLRSLAPSCRFCAHGRFCRVALNVSDPFPKPLEPRCGRPLVSSEPSPRDQAVPPRSCPAPGRWITGVRPRSNGLGLISADLISALQSKSDRLLSSPHPCPCRWARLVSPPWFADTPSPPVSRVLALAPARASAGCNPFR